MISILKSFRNFIKVKFVNRTVNKYRLYGEPKVRLTYKHMLKRAMVKVIRLRVDGITYSLLVLSQKAKQPNITYLDFIWINSQKAVNPENREVESAYYQAMYDIFMHWHESIIVSKVVRKKINNFNVKHTIAINLNITLEQQIERFRRILTLYGFSANEGLTLNDELEFKKPYREKEVLTHVVYTRTI